MGGLAARREALQQQIEALEQFDRDYRSRLTAFMQSQLRQLWVDQPQVNGDSGKANGPAPGGVPAGIPTARPASGAASGGAPPAAATRSARS